MVERISKIMEQKVIIIKVVIQLITTEKSLRFNLSLKNVINL